MSSNIQAHFHPSLQCTGHTSLSPEQTEHERYSVRLKSDYKADILICSYHSAQLFKPHYSVLPFNLRLKFTQKCYFFCYVSYRDTEIQRITTHKITNKKAIICSALSPNYQIPSDYRKVYLSLLKFISLSGQSSF